MKTCRLLFVLCFSLMCLSGCAALVGASAGAVGIAAVKEGGLSSSLTDARIQTTINDLWFRHDLDIFRKLDLTVNQGRVLITGTVQDPEHRVDAVRLAWKASGVKQVINEINVAEGGGVTGYLSDTWIVTQLRTGITLDEDIQNLNYTIDAVSGNVYLMGVAQSRDELNRVVERARTINGVQQVISYVKLVGRGEIETVQQPRIRTTTDSVDFNPNPQPVDAPLGARDFRGGFDPGPDPLANDVAETYPAASPGPVVSEPLPLF